MTRDEIALGFRMVAMGRPNQEHAEKLIDALAVLLATPADQPAVNSETSDTLAEPAPKRRGRPPKVPA